MMSVKARFRVHSVREPWPGTTEVLMSPVYSSDPSDPNHSWSLATPSGQISMNTTNPSAAAAFEVNKTYEITFEEVAP